MDDEVEQSLRSLEALQLAPHEDRPKNWDCYRALSLILQCGSTDSSVLEVGAEEYSVILPWLQELGFTKLYGCDLCYSEASFRRGHIVYERQDLQHTNYRTGSFDFIASISVIEHGVDPRKYFHEMSRLLRPGGYLMTSTDYW